MAKLIREALNNCCQLDTAPRWLVKQFNGLLAPFIALLFNTSVTSLSTGASQQSLNMRSSLLCSKKVVVTTVSWKTTDQSPIDRSCLNCPGRWSSPETVAVPRRQQRRHAEISVSIPTISQHGNNLNKLLKDLLAADQGQVSTLCLLDLTAAFDTIDQSFLLTRLQKCFGVDGCCPKWFTSYLSGRSYWVVADGVSSKVIYILCSVPQGSVLGPVLFILYMADLADVAAEQGMSLHAYADDNQRYIHCQPEHAQGAVFGVQQYVSIIEKWMAASRLRLNMDKTELIWTITKYNVSKIPVCCRSLTLGGAQVVASDVVCPWSPVDVGLIILDKHVTAVSAKCFF